MAKDIKYNLDARDGSAPRRRPVGQHGKGNLGTERPQCSDRQSIRWSSDHQGRRNGRQGDELSDRLETWGPRCSKQVASKTNDLAGDGTTTATVLAQAIVKEWFE